MKSKDAGICERRQAASRIEVQRDTERPGKPVADAMSRGEKNGQDARDEQRFEEEISTVLNCTTPASNG